MEAPPGISERSEKYPAFRDLTFDPCRQTLAIVSIQRNTTQSNCMRIATLKLLALVPTLFLLPPTALPAGGHPPGPPPWLNRSQWMEVNPDAEWAPRAGLQVVELHNTFYLMGGRTPIDPAVLPLPGASVIWGDVWRSRDLGRSWQKLVEQDPPVIGRRAPTFRR